MKDKEDSSFCRTIQIFGYAIFCILSILSALLGLFVALGFTSPIFSEQLTKLEIALNVTGSIISGILAFITIFGLGFLISKVLTSFIIGFGELIEDTRIIKLNLMEMNDLLQTKQNEEK